MLTPLDIHNKDFATRFKGYDAEEVNDFLDEVIRTMEQLIRENKDLEKRVRFNEEKVEYFNALQETLNKSIIVAQEAADRLRENAHKEAAIIRYEAEREAENLLKEAAAKATHINSETDAMKQETRLFRKKLQIMVESQLEIIKNAEWDELLRSSKTIEVVPPTVESLLQKRNVGNVPIPPATTIHEQVSMPTSLEAQPVANVQEPVVPSAPEQSVANEAM